MPPRQLRILPLCFALIWAAVSPVAGRASTPWPHETGDVTPDPAIRWGRLENGLRFAVRKNSEPAGRVYLILQVAAGAVNERDDQRGYAHFVEHMMFRGTRKFPATSLVNFLQHEGLAMGADSSAFTTSTSTFYNLDLPHNSPEKIALGLSILRDFADGAVFAKAEVKPEAKVIESERRTRETSASQIGELLASFLYPGSLIPHRMPIGTPESVLSATAERLQEFYRQWYRPSRLTVIAVGDAEPDLLEKLIREQFASLQPATAAEPVDPDLGLRAPSPDLQARFFTNPEPGGTTCLLYSLTAVEPQPDTVARRRQIVFRNAALGIFNARLGDLARLQPLDIGTAQAGWTSEFGRMQQVFVRVDTRAEKWRAGLRTAEQELRRALLHGFTADEVKLQIQAGESALQEGIRTEATRQSQYLAQAIRSGLETNFTVTAPRTDQEMLASVVHELTPEQCNDAFRAIWAGANRRLVVVGRYPVPLTEKDLLAAYGESTFSQLLAEKDARAILPFDYTSFGPSGTVASRRHDDGLDITSIAFANGVRLNLKPTDFEKGRVYVRLRLGRGLAAEPADQPGLGLLTGLTYLPGGLGRYDNNELGRRFAADALFFNFTVEEDGFYFSGYASPDKLEKLLQVVTAFMTDPAFRPEGLLGAIPQLQLYYRNVGREPVQFLNAICPLVMASGDTRYGLVPSTKISERKPEEIAKWLKPVLAHGAIELGLAGDLDVDNAVGAVARTLGALPSREPEPPLDQARRPKLPARTLHLVWALEGSEPDKAAVRIFWPGVGGSDYHNSRKLEVLADILNDRLRVKIREELGATYGPLQQEWGSEIWPDYGYSSIGMECAPVMAERVTTLARKIAVDLATNGITPDEFERIMAPRRASLAQVLHSNGYWVGNILCHAQDQPDRLNWPRTRDHDYLTMQRQDIEEVARRFLRPDHIYTFIARPK